MSKRVGVQSQQQSEANSLAGSKITEKIVLKKTTVIGIIVKRLLSSQLEQSFRVLKNTGKGLKAKHTM